MVKQLNIDTLTWQGNAPVAPAFDDVYYSVENGLEETKFVFLSGTNAPDSWSEKKNYVIAETGFGTGLNFLATWQAWINSGQKGQLTFISTEAFPLADLALEKAHQTFPTLADYARQLRAAWPAPIPGFHFRKFENGQIRLLLLFGDVTKTLPTLEATVDAWFLDGFAPAKNPAMWSDAVFDQIARLSGSGTRFATFTAAGFVRRGLQERGFTVEKVPGYGRKRERLIGIMHEKHTVTYAKASVPNWATLPTPSISKKAIVIGGGIAGSSMAAALMSRGKDVTLLIGKEATASHVPAAILSPSLQENQLPATLFALSCFCHASWLPEYKEAWAKDRGVHQINESVDHLKKMHAIAAFLDWPESWLKTNGNGVFLPRGGSLNTDIALQTFRKDIHAIETTVLGLEKVSSGWVVHTEQGPQEADTVIVAAGAYTTHLIHGGINLHMRPKAGQCELYISDTKGLPAENISAAGYITSPSAHNGTNIQTLGSTFDLLDTTNFSVPSVSSSKHTKTVGTLESALNITVDETGYRSSWVGVRATCPDHNPLVGPVPDWEQAAEDFALLAKDSKIRNLGHMPYQKGLYVMAGFSSKGFQQAPMAAEYLAALICKEPLPISLPTSTSLHPARHMIRRIIRGHQ